MSAVLGLSFILACGGNGEGIDVLHLDGGNIGTDDYRRYLRAQFSGDPTSTDLCTQIANLSPEGILVAGGETPGNEEVEFDPVPDGWQAVPGQVADADDLLASATVFKEECELFIR